MGDGTTLDVLICLASGPAGNDAADEIDEDELCAEEEEDEEGTTDDDTGDAAGASIADDLP